MNLTLPRFMNFDSLKCFGIAQRYEFDLTVFYEFQVKKYSYRVFLIFTQLCLSIAPRCEIDLTAIYEFLVKKYSYRVL